MKIARRSNYNIDLRKLRVNKITGRRNHKAALRNDSSFAVQFSISVSKTRRAILLFKIKIKLIEMFELHERNARDAIRLISSDNPAKIFHDYT